MYKHYLFSKIFFLVFLSIYCLSFPKIGLTQPRSVQFDITLNYPDVGKIENLVIARTGGRGPIAIKETGPLENGPKTFNVSLDTAVDPNATCINFYIQIYKTTDSMIQYKGLCYLKRPDNLLNIVKYSFELPPIASTKSGSMLVVKQTDETGTDVGNCYLEQIGK